MSLWSRLKDAVLDAPLNIPTVRALGETQGYVAFSLDDPRIVEYLRGGRASSSGVVVNEQMAMRNSAINRAVRLVCSAIAMLPCHLFETTTETVKLPAPEGSNSGEAVTIEREVASKATDHPVFNLLHKKPNSFQTAFEFWTYMVSRAIFDGVAYGWKKYAIDAKVRGGRRVKAIIPLNPARVEFKLNDEFEPEFFYSQKQGGKIKIPAEDMFWFRSPYSQDGVTGAKLVDVAVEAIGLANQMERASGRVMKNGALVGGVLEHPKSLTEPAANRLKADFEDRHSSPENAGKWIVADEGMKVVQGSGGSTLKEAQTLEQRKFLAEEAGRFLDIPRPLLMLDETSWGTGIEALGLFFVTYCLMPWFVSIEQAIWRSLLSESEQATFFAKFNEAALLRGSLKDQAEFFAKALGSGGGKGWMTQNEVRDKFNQGPKPGGDDLPQPVAKKPDKDSGEEGDDEGGENDRSPKPPTR